MAQLAQAGESGQGIQIPGFLQRVGEYPRRLRQFLHDVRVEMRHVNWPSRDDVISTTAVVAVTVVFFAAFFFVADYVLGRLLAMVLKH